jgi:hypothetical protein
MSTNDADVDTWVEEFRRIWPTSSQIGRWLDSSFDPPWPGDIRTERDQDERSIWVIPDYEKGRSRSLAVEREVLRDVPYGEIIQVLEASDWARRLNREDLLVRRTARGELEVVSWEAPRFDKWFWSPEHGQWFVAFQTASRAISTGAPPPPIQDFVAIHGQNYSAIGADGLRDISNLRLEEIKDSLPAL